MTTPYLGVTEVRLWKDEGDIISAGRFFLESRPSQVFLSRKNAFVFLRTDVVTRLIW